ncbi:MAG: peptidylprolyl isomerase [Candidatus Faecousia sp.]|uniref:peptidylprolyl isomerase n=1 Tax=Faecousia sp. TaxID=2952921 RepID=UPI002A842390|nr:peptidylprolyl isomerase [Candidatus Faecousia sp.]
MGQAKSKKNQKKAQPKKPLWPWLTAAGVCVAVLAGVLIWALTSGGGSAESGKHHVAITVRDYGTITVELDADAAPITVQNFLDLAGSGFYDGLTFHRIMEGFMIQGGDPEGTGMGGSDKTIKGEFSANGVENPLSHTRGAISMARSSAMDSASSQFFIVQKDSTFLDGQYACFGYVTNGMDVVDAIAADAQPTDGNGTIPADQQPVIESVKVLD